MSIPLQVSRLVKKYKNGPQAVKGISFDIQEAEVFGFLGPNGAGKTTTISVITGLEQATSGRIKVFGHDVQKNARTARALMGVVPQELVTHGYFSLEEVLRFHSGYYGLLQNQGRIEYLMERLLLTEHRHKKVRQLSGGMRRRLMLAKALVHAPRLILLDEPTAGVDVHLRENIWELIDELRQDGVSVLLTTHYIEEAEALCDRVGIVHHGEIRAMGSTQLLVKDLSLRMVQVEFKPGTVPDINHPQLQARDGNSLVFCLPQKATAGSLLGELLDYPNLMDVRIKEGSLEEALKRVISA